MNWQDDIAEMRRVPMALLEGLPYVRLADVPEQVRGWFEHWLTERDLSVAVTEAGDVLARRFDYDAWVTLMEERYRLAEQAALDDPDRIE